MIRSKNVKNKNCVQMITLLNWNEGYFFFFLRAVLLAYGSSQLGVKLELRLLAYAITTTTGSEQHLQPTPQFMAMPDP